MLESYNRVGDIAMRDVAGGPITGNEWGRGYLLIKPIHPQHRLKP